MLTANMSGVLAEQSYGYPEMALDMRNSPRHMSQEKDVIQSTLMIGL